VDADALCPLRRAKRISIHPTPAEKEPLLGPLRPIPETMPRAWRLRTRLLDAGEQVVLTQPRLRRRVGAHEMIGSPQQALHPAQQPLPQRGAPQLAGMAAGRGLLAGRHPAVADAGMGGEIPLGQQGGEIDIVVAAEAVRVPAQERHDAHGKAHKAPGHGVEIQLLGLVWR